MSNETTNHDPLQDYLDETEKTAAERNRQDFTAWQEWKADPSKQNLGALLGRFDSDFNKTIGRLKAPNVSEAALRGNMMSNAIEAFQRFDPSYVAPGGKPATLRTWVNTHINRATRTNKRYQNMAYIPEGKSDLIGQINVAADTLRQQFGREPTHAELGAHLGKPPKLIQEVQGLQRADVLSSAFESDPTALQSVRHAETVALLPAELNSDDERTVFDYMFGRNGKPVVSSTGEIARRMGKSPSQVSRLKKRVEAKYKRYI